MTPRAILPLTLTLGALLSPGIVLASDPYPEYVFRIYGTPHEPECTLCHSTLEGGDNTITTKFGKNLEALGARGKIPDTLTSALVAAANARQDSDEDGATDLQELRDGTDPNLEGDAILGAGGGGAGEELDLGGLDALPPLPAHGCAMESSSNKSGLLSLVCVAALAALRRRRR